MSLPLEAETLADLAELDGRTLKQRTFRPQRSRSPAQPTASR